MNPWQLAQQLRHVLGATRWAGGDPVFGVQGVRVYAGLPSEDDLPAGFPFALVSIDGAQADPDDPGLLDQQFTVAVVVEVAGDPLGEHAIIGGARASMGRSAGAGVAEVVERARAAIGSLTGFDGAAIVVSSSGALAPQVVGQGRQVAMEQLQFRALCTSAPVWAAPQMLRVSGQTFRWDGRHCSARFDFARFRLGYRTGTVPATTPAELTATIYTGPQSQYAVAPVSGRVYQVFAEYDPRGTGTPPNWSAPEIGAWIAL